MFGCLGFGFLGLFRCSGVQGWMKMVWDESVIGRNRFWMKVSLDEPVFWMKVSWMKLSSLLDEMVLDESVFG